MSLFGKCHREEAQAGVATVTFHEERKPFICSTMEDDKTIKKTQPNKQTKGEKKNLSRQTGSIQL